MAEAEMIERVARAICAAEDLRWEDQADPMRSASGDVNTEHYLHIARAAIEAMREPTRTMIERGSDQCDGSTSAAEGVWWNMIDAALAEPTASR